MLDDFYDKFYIIKICFSIIIRNIFWAIEDISKLAVQVVYEEVITGTKVLAHECSQICDEIGIQDIMFFETTEQANKNAIWQKMNEEALEEMQKKKKVSD